MKLRMTQLIEIFLLINLGYCISIKAEIMALNRQGQQIQFKKYNFLDESGKSVNLSSYFQPKKPVFLVPVYFDCPGVCTLTLNQLFENLKKMKFNPGRAIEIIVFSINPNEKSELALKKKQNYLHRFGYESFSQGFHFLVADQKQISSLTEELGFIYEQKENEYFHPGVTYLLTPTGQISKLLTVKNQSIKKIKDYVYQAAHGRKISAFEKMALACKKQIN